MKSLTRMPPESSLAVSSLDLTLGGGLFYTEDLVRLDGRGLVELQIVNVCRHSCCWWCGIGQEIARLETRETQDDALGEHARSIKKRSQATEARTPLCFFNTLVLLLSSRKHNHDTTQPP